MNSLEYHKGLLYSFTRLLEYAIIVVFWLLIQVL